MLADADTIQLLLVILMHYILMHYMKCGTYFWYDRMMYQTLRFFVLFQVRPIKDLLNDIL